MRIQERPNLEKISKGNSLKIYQIIGMLGDVMPHYTCPKEAILTVLEGEARVDMTEDNYLLKEKYSFVIQAKKEHKLTILKNFKAVMVMENESEIDFV